MGKSKRIKVSKQHLPKVSLTDQIQDSDTVKLKNKYRKGFELQLRDESKPQEVSVSKKNKKPLYTNSNPLHKLINFQNKKNLMKTNLHKIEKTENSKNIAIIKKSILT